MKLIKTLAAVGAAALISASTLNVAEASAFNFGLNGLNTISTLQAARNAGPGQASHKSVKGGSRTRKAGHGNARNNYQGGQRKGMSKGGKARQHQNRNGSKVRKSGRSQKKGGMKKQHR